MISNPLISRLSQFDRVIMSYNDEYPQLLKLENIIFDKNSIKLNISIKNTNATVLFSYNDPYKRNYEFLELIGRVENNEFYIENVMGWDTDKQEFTGYVQQSIPDGSQYLQRYNDKLYRSILEQNEAMIITSFRNQSRSQIVELKRSDDTLEFEISSEDPVFKQLLVISGCKLYFNHSNEFPTARNIFLEGNIKKYEDRFVFYPHKMIYGDQSELETIRLTNQSNLIDDVKEAFRYNYQYWKQILRIPIFISTILPILLGTVLADKFNWILVLLIVTGFLMVQIGMNLIFDYVDHKNQNDEFKIKSSLLSGGRYIDKGLATPGGVISTGVSMVIIAIAIGMYLNSLLPGNTVLYLSLAGGILAYSYSGRPFRLSHKGLGELVIILIFGPIPVFASYYILSSDTDLLYHTILLGITPGLYSGLIVIMNNMIDLEADERANRKTLVLKLGRHRSKFLIRFISIFTAIYLVPFILFGFLESAFTLTLLILPITVLFNKELDTMNERRIYLQILMLNIISTLLLIIALLII